MYGTSEQEYLKCSRAKSDEQRSIGCSGACQKNFEKVDGGGLEIKIKTFRAQ